MASKQSVAGAVVAASTGPATTVSHPEVPHYEAFKHLEEGGKITTKEFVQPDGKITSWLEKTVAGGRPTLVRVSPGNMNTTQLGGHEMFRSYIIVTDEMLPQ